ARKKRERKRLTAVRRLVQKRQKRMKEMPMPQALMSLKVLGIHRLDMEGVTGSIPVVSTIFAGNSVRPQGLSRN
ncbi:MAG TPA: hypothetical protein VGU20_12665, partial [Stellaceae bacterium]|nr:hypothetical protein [Stellaceae bacterium]